MTMYTNLQAQLPIFEQLGMGGDSLAKYRKVATRLFEKAFTRGRRNRWLARITRSKNQLETCFRLTGTARGTTATVNVPISKIVGSENRTKDFDAGFNPLRTHTRDRWIGIAAARMSGVVLPAVDLVRVGEAYYVRDGHHRISVARSLGQLDIEARIVN